MRKIYSYLFFFIFCFSAMGQKEVLDSLQNQLRVSSNDTIKVNVLNNLFLQFEFEDDQKAKTYLNQALELGKKNNFKTGLSTTYMYMGYFAEDKGNYPEAFKNYFSALKLKEELGNKTGVAAVHLCIGNVYNSQENYDLALGNYTAALNIYTALGNELELATVRNNLGGILYHKGKYVEALKSYNMALDISTKLGDKRGMANCNGNVGNLYQTIGEFDKSIEKYIVAIKLYEEIGAKGGLAATYANIGIVYTKLKKFNKSENYLEKAKALASEIGYNECLRDTYCAISEVDSAKGDYRAAFANHKLYIQLKDSLDNEETRKKTIQNQMTYDFDKKEAVADAEHKKELENQNVLAQEKSRKQKIVLSLVLGSLLLVLIFAGFIFRSLRITRKQKALIEQQKNIVEQQKQEVELQKIIVEEHQKAIIDSITYARRIQQSLLPTEKYIEGSLKRLRKK